MELVKAPWTDEQIKALEEYQTDGRFHPYTCGSNHKGLRILTPTKDGWVCKYCEYKQDWCHSFHFKATA
jgi:hypothetical protein